jgi:hypothetical protein
MEYVSFNQYQKLAELEVLSKKLEIASVISAFGEQETASGSVLKSVPLSWIITNYLDWTPEQLDSMSIERKKEYKRLGFNEDGSNPLQQDEQDNNDRMMDQEFRMNEMQMQSGMGEDEEGYDEDEEYGPPQRSQQQNQRRR